MLTGIWCSKNCLGRRINHRKGDIKAAWWTGIWCSFAPGQNAFLLFVILTSSKNRVLRIPVSWFSEKHPRCCSGVELILLLLVLLGEFYPCWWNVLLMWNFGVLCRKVELASWYWWISCLCLFQLLPWKFTVRSFLHAMAVLLWIDELTVQWPNGMPSRC